MSDEDLHSNGVSGSGEWIDFSKILETLERVQAQMKTVSMEVDVLSNTTRNTKKRSYRRRIAQLEAQVEELQREIKVRDHTINNLKGERSLLARSRENLERTLLNTQINRDALSARVQELERELTIAYTRDPPRKPSPPPPSSRRRTQRGLDTTMREDDSPGVE